MSKVKFDDDFIALDDRRNVELVLEQIQDETNHLASLEERLPIIEIRDAPVGSEVQFESQGTPTIFIGHGHSEIWKDLRDFIRDRLQIQLEEFNRVSPAGISVTDRLAEMLARANFALLVLTGEDEQADGSWDARLNVVHEAGLFQGRLGFRRAIVLLEDGCQEFSNIHGLGQIRFPKGNIAAKFEEIREVLEREALLPRAGPL
jgi:predicted nucleotide-binding protein